MKSGILLAVFGVGSAQGESILRFFEMRVRVLFPGVPVRWAFTSDRLRERLALSHKKSDSVRKALDKMAFERFTHVAVQPLYAISGLEYADIITDVDEARHKSMFTSLTLGQPLLTESGVDRVAQSLRNELPPDRTLDEAVLFMGHGSRHPSECLYAELAASLQGTGSASDSLLFVATLSGSTRLEHILPYLHEASVRRAWLMPLLGLVGKHTLEDMAGTGATSWRSRLEAEGIECRPVLKGLLESSGMADIWLEHLRQAMPVVVV